MAMTIYLKGGPCNGERVTVNRPLPEVLLVPAYIGEETTPTGLREMKVALYRRQGVEFHFDCWERG